MPCDSRVTATKMTEAERIGQAMTALGYTGVTVSERSVVGNLAGTGGLMFTSYGTNAVFSTTATNLKAIQAVQKKYSEMGLRAFAKAKGYTITRDGEKFVLQNRRG